MIAEIFSALWNSMAELTPRSGVLCEKFIVDQLVKKFVALESECSSLFSQESTTRPYTEPIELCSNPDILLLKIHFNITFPLMYQVVSSLRFSD